MPYALIGNPFTAVLEIYPGDDVPDHVKWPDGAITHGAPVGITWQGWQVVPLVQVGDRPNVLASYVGFSDSFDGTNVVRTSLWKSPPLEDVIADAKERLKYRVDKVQRSARPAGDSVFIQERVAQARAANSTAQVGQFPLLDSLVGTYGDDIPAVASAVLSEFSTWLATANSVAIKYQGGIKQLARASTIDGALAKAKVIEDQLTTTMVNWSAFLGVRTK